MFEILEKLRGQSEGKRKMIAFLSALGIAVIILAVWATVLMPDWNASQSQQAKAAAASPSPLSTFGATLGAGFSAIGSQFGELKSTMSSLTTPQPTHYEATTTNQQ